MMKAVANSCAALGVECQLALERYMGCGLGTCQSCAVKIRDATPDGWSYKLCCTDGPVFDANVVIWK
jgi:dihydroorotate dehydrogenase electron transfer subunit